MKYQVESFNYDDYPEYDTMDHQKIKWNPVRDGSYDTREDADVAAMNLIRRYGDGADYRVTERKEK